MDGMTQFFKDSKGGNSMSLLLLFGSFMVTAVIMLALTYQDKMSEGYLTIFLGAFVANVAIKRTADYKQTQAENPVPAAPLPPPVPPAAASAVTVIASPSPP